METSGSDFAEADLRFAANDDVILTWQYRDGEISREHNCPMYTCWRRLRHAYGAILRGSHCTLNTICVVHCTP